MMISNAQVGWLCAARIEAALITEGHGASDWNMVEANAKAIAESLDIADDQPRVRADRAFTAESPTGGATTTDPFSKGRPKP